MHALYPFVSGIIFGDSLGLQHTHWHEKPPHKLVCVHAHINLTAWILSTKCKNILRRLLVMYEVCDFSRLCPHMFQSGRWQLKIQIKFDNDGKKFPN